ncbi:Serine-threonine/tyrosine-protein kinase, catalytic domain [Dillenia turbinata]|uniref:Serine-threonine/tyrosine-protein kinase, catalytic domain n=1 Tax=Dillenia turbinata TaxID=194707 RepID=A0AAN8URF4_9MAGN
MTDVRGTFGCLAPEWLHSRSSVKADIYSFGIVLLEVVSGKRNLDYSRPDSDAHLFSILQNKALEDQLVNRVDSQSQGMQQNSEEAVRMMNIGTWCTNSDSTKRPPMSQVVKVLEGDVVLKPDIFYSFPATESAIPLSCKMSGYASLEPSGYSLQNKTSAILKVQFAQPSKFIFPANMSTTWINNVESIPSSKHFEDGSTARFILLQQANPVITLIKTLALDVAFIAVHRQIVHIPSQVAWSANGDRPIRENATLEFTQARDLILADADSTVVWSANTSGRSVYYIELEISGNWIVYSQSSDQGISNSNSSSGLFYVSLDSGSLVAFVDGERPTRYLSWSSCQEGNYLLSYISFQLEEIAFYCESRNDTHVSKLQIPKPDGSFGFVRLDSGRGLRIYGWENSTGRKVMHSFTDSNECQVPLNAFQNLTSKETCLQACLERDSCKAAFLKYGNAILEGFCYLPTEVLSIIGALPYTEPEPAASQSQKHVFLVIAVTLAILTTILAVSLFLLQKRKMQKRKNLECPGQAPEVLVRFSYGELCIATKNFSEKLGSGGYGRVFKGMLKDGTVVAVKRLDGIGQGTKEFLAEVDSIGNLHHINLVKLIGFCVEKSHNILLYENMSNSSLDKGLFDENKSPNLDWKTRKQIVLDIAKALAYLHEDYMVDSRSQDMQQNSEEAVRMMKIGMWSANGDSTQRPSMSQAVKVLEGDVGFDPHMVSDDPDTVSAFPLCSNMSGYVSSEPSGYSTQCISPKDPTPDWVSLELSSSFGPKPGHDPALGSPAMFRATSSSFNVVRVAGPGDIGS